MKIIIPTKVFHFLFVATVFFYPFKALSHVVYLIPQGIIIVGFIISVCQRESDDDVDRRTALIFLAALAAVISAWAVEFFADSPSYDLVIKLVVNLINLCLVVAGRMLIFSMATMRALRWCAFSWFFCALAAYIFADTSIIQLYFLFSSGEGVDSSTLYGVASPLENIFLTKNISAMFIVSVFSFFLYLKLNYKHQLKYWEMAIFFLSVLVFFSRQAIVAFVGLLMVYRVLQGISIKTIFLIGVGVFVGVQFFALFFDLQSSGDGASQRIELWTFFFENVRNFLLDGYGLYKMNSLLESQVGIDNFHMFFMNQIGAYGILHFLYFSGVCVLIISGINKYKYFWILIAGYYFNVMFQTYGYEYGNLFLFMVMASQYFSHENKS